MIKKFFRGCLSFILTLFLIVLLLIFSSIYFYIDGVPAVSNIVVNRLPVSIDYEAGEKARKEILRDAPIDENKTKILNEFYKELRFDSSTKLYVIKANEFNAFALPDNSIFVFDKVLQDVSSYKELAALLSHEYAHIKYRHGMKGVAQKLSWELLSKILSGEDNSDNFIKNSNLLLSLKNSRKFETQADIGGLELLRKQHIEQQGMINLFELMLKLPKEDKEEKPSYLNTHPDTDSRLIKTKEEIRAKPEINIENSKLDSIFLKLKE